MQILKFKNNEKKQRDLVASLKKQRELIARTLTKHQKLVTENKTFNYYKIKQWIVNNNDILLESYYDSISNGQVESKLWLVTELKNLNLLSINLHIEIIGGWFGYPLIEMLTANFNIKQIDFYETDQQCIEVLWQYMHHFQPPCKIVVFRDYFERKELRSRDLIINTSCEHMKDIAEMKQYYKTNTVKPLIALQSNNYEVIEDHINWVNTTDELIKKNELDVIFFKGQKKLPLYDRFMAIGQW